MSFLQKQNERKLHAALQEKVPTNAVDYCLSLWKEHPFNFTITKNRKTVLGNYKFQNKTHYISVNKGLNPFSFLITYLHEIAHQRVQKNTKFFRVKPHGNEWKTQFKTLLTPMLKEEIFPEPLLIVLKKHMLNPAASSMADPQLVKELRKFNSNQSLLSLNDLSMGDTFIFKNRTFIKVEAKRTRALVKEVKSNKNYTIPLSAEITQIIN